MTWAAHALGSDNDGSQLVWINPKRYFRSIAAHLLNSVKSATIAKKQEDQERKKREEAAEKDSSYLLSSIVAMSSSILEVFISSRGMWQGMVGPRWRIRAS
jgi:hypothetical protein